MTRDNNITAGYLLCSVSAIAFAAKGIFTKLIYAYGVDPVTLLALRFLLALPFFWATLIFFPSGKVKAVDLLVIIGSGLLGQYAAALADFYGLLYVDASLERIILYTYPAIVVVLAVLFFKERLGKRKVVSIGLTYLGLVLALKLFSPSREVSMYGAGLILFSAVVYAGSYLITEVVSRRVSGVKISTYSTTSAAVAFLLTWHGKALPEEAGAWWLLVLLAVFSTYVPVLTLALGIKRIGASRAALVSFAGPVSTAVLAYFILGERLDYVQISGMALVIAGVLTISIAKGKKRATE